MMRRIYLILFLFVLLIGWAPTVRAELVVIVNCENDLSQMNKNEVIDLYMGRYMIFPNGASALPIDQPVNSETRENFYALLTGKTVAQVNAYWARLIFTGRATPPRVMPDVEATLRVVRENKDAIAYLNRKDIDDTVKVVFSLDQ